MHDRLHDTDHDGWSDKVVEKSTFRNSPIGLKFDGDKPDWSLLPWKQIETIVKVMDMGKKKYSRDNWQSVEDGKNRYSAACMRHLTAYWSGEKIDPESGISHLGHAMCCLLFMMWFEDNGKT